MPTRETSHKPLKPAQRARLRRPLCRSGLRSQALTGNPGPPGASHSRSHQTSAPPRSPISETVGPQTQRPPGSPPAYAAAVWRGSSFVSMDSHQSHVSIRLHNLFLRSRHLSVLASVCITNLSGDMFVFFIMAFPRRVSAQRVAGVTSIPDLFLLPGNKRARSRFSPGRNVSCQWCSPI